jgi:toxin ParE1/3/4
MARKERRAEYRLTPAAQSDLEAIWLYSLDAWGGDRARRYTDDLTAAFKRLAKNPRLGMSSDHIREGYRMARVGRHVIFFRVTDYGIAVIRVLHDRMDALRHL